MLRASFLFHPGPLIDLGLEDISINEQNYIRNLVTYPDKGSKFDGNLPLWVKLGLRTPVVRNSIFYSIGSKLVEDGHDLLVARSKKNNSIIGHFALQRHELQWHVYHTYVQSEDRRNGLATKMALFLADVQSNYGIAHIQLGNGNNPKATGLLEKLATYDSLDVDLQNCTYKTRR